jgi:hypothetical protein
VKEYPTISNKPVAGTPVYGFDKLDGSNVRAAWTPKKGFWKFGRRTGLLDDSNPHLVKADKFILDKYGDSLSKIFKAERWVEATAFFEFWGPNSFAGNHEANDEHTVERFPYPKP